MSGDPFGIAFEDLPEALSIFPLPGVLLLPRGRLPLNIFEPRYLNLFLDALAEQRLVGMVQTTEPQAGLVPDEAKVFETGCAGRIVSFAETGDGRLVLSLEGVCRFKIAGELELRRDYRRVTPDFAPFQPDVTEESFEFDRGGFFDVLRSYLQAKHIDVEWSALEQTEDRQLIANLGIMCPFDIQEKQALLEAPDITEMVKIMTSLMEMAARAANQSSARH